MSTTSSFLRAVAAASAFAGATATAGADIGAPAASTYQTVHAFGRTSADGVGPWSAMIQAKDGNLYGVTAYGGQADGGTVFRVTRAGKYSVLHSFAVTQGDGSWTYSSGLVEASDGNLYGTTSHGGAFGMGTIYRITPGGEETVIHSLAADGSEGMLPNTLMQASDGFLYGTTFSQGFGNSGGTAFRVTLDGELTVLHQFGLDPGGYPHNSFAALVEGEDGFLYGTSNYGGTAGIGTVFRMSKTGSVTTLHSFTGPDGAYPIARLVQTPDGLLYGTADAGGASNVGVVYRIGTSGGAFSVLHHFANDGIDGNVPYSELVLAADGSLYGTARLGGTGLDDGGDGILYKLSRSGAYTTLHNFWKKASDGCTPVGAIVQATDGNLYGVTPNCGNHEDGTIFRYTPSN